MRYILVFAIVSFLCACNRPAKQAADKDKNAIQPTIYTTSAGDKIVFLEDYYKAYYKAIKANYPNRDEIYEEQVHEPIFNNYFTKSEYSQSVGRRLATSIKDTTLLGKYISTITDNRLEMEKIITSALADCRKYLKNDSITIYVLPSNQDVYMVTDGMGGVSGLTAGSKQIILTINPAIDKWKEMLSYNIAHEFNHTYWTKMDINKTPWNMLTYLVFEGRADSYAHLIYPNTVCPWTKALSEDAESVLWKRIKSQLDNTSIAFQYSVMFGVRNEFPYWGGYTLGYHIVQSALKNHPELTPEEWTNLSPEKMLAMSDYISK